MKHLRRQRIASRRHGDGRVLFAARRKAAPSDRQNRRRGVEVFELILAIPVLFITTVALFEFGILMLVGQAVTAAAVEGARKGAEVGATTDDVAEVVQSFLAIHDLSFVTTGTNSGTITPVFLTVEREDGGGGVDVEERGDTDLDSRCSREGPNPDVDEVVVSVCVLITNGDDDPVPNFLNPFGFSLSGKVLNVSSRAQLE